MNPAVAVVIPAYNAARTIGDTLRALQQQKIAERPEIIVVDNGSSDDTARVAGEHGARVLTESRRGPSAARNRGLYATTAHVVAHLDADTVPSRRWLAELSAPFADMATVIVAGNTQCYPPATAAERYVAAAGLYDTPRAIGRTPFPFVPSLNMAVRREAALAIGGWAEDMPTGEDVDFSHRILKAYAATIVYAPGALLYHRTRSDRDALRRQAWTYGEGAAQLYLRYPEELRWTFSKSVALASQLTRRAYGPLLCRAAIQLGRADRSQLEFAEYHRLWSITFWRGFFEVYLRKGRVA